jgi:hypothetical protein
VAGCPVEYDLLFRHLMKETETVLETLWVGKIVTIVIVYRLRQVDLQTKMNNTATNSL